MIYGFIRFGLIPISFIGWILYQVFSKKKTWRELQPDVMMIIIFIIVWILIYSLFLD